MRSEKHVESAIVRLYGDFDVSCEQRFRQGLARALDGETSTLILDLRALAFIDSVGLRVLLSIDSAARREGFELKVLCGDGQVRHVLSVTGLDRRLPLVDHSGLEPTSDSPA